MTATQQDIQKKSDNFEKELDMFHKNMLRLCWYMRGGVTIEQMYDMPPAHLEHINSIVEDNFEMSKKAGMPII